VQDGLKRVLDYTDYLAAPEDGKRYEILSGDLLVTPAPRPTHQRVLGRLVRALGEYFEKRAGEVFFAPIDLILTSNDVLQPDLLVVDDPAFVTDRGIEGAPLLVVEYYIQVFGKRKPSARSDFARNPFVQGRGCRVRWIQVILSAQAVAGRRFLVGISHGEYQ
jgi:Uma2 family endonuclease